MEEDYDQLIAIAAVLLATRTVQHCRAAVKIKRKHWTLPWIAKRSQLGIANLVGDLKLQDAENFRVFLRMNVDTFESFLNKVGPLIAKQDTRFRRPISASDRLALTLRYLATGESRASLHFQFRIGRSTVNGIIAQVVSAIYTCLNKSHLKIPASEVEWKTISQDYFHLWNFPNCLGAMDGKHVRLQQPHHSGSQFFNYKHYFSIVLFAIVDAHLKFVYVDVGTNGRISDGGVLAKSSFKNAMDASLLNMPLSGTIPGTETQAPYVFIADDAFTLTTRIMKPYPGQNLDHSKRVHNYRLSRARRTVENAFGILSSKFCVFKQEINSTLEQCQGITLACCVLHNFLKDTDGTSYLENGALDHENLSDGTVTHGTWREEVPGFHHIRNTGGRPELSAMTSRDTFKDYFNGPGVVSWQDRMIEQH